MIRLIHAQTTAGAILVDDIDDGLPNKEVYRLGSTADPKAYARDGYSNAPKQSCYIPKSHLTPTGSTLNGFITLNMTDRVRASSTMGRIAKMVTAGLITTVTVPQGALATPVVSAATTTSGNFVITGTTLKSYDPVTTLVTLAQGAGASAPAPLTWTQADIATAGGTISATSISIPASAFTTAPVTANTVRVNANEANSNLFVST